MHGPADLVSVFKDVMEACKKPTYWLKMSKCKYVEICVDLRTGSFLVKDQEGQLLNKEEVEEFLITLVD